MKYKSLEYSYNLIKLHYGQQSAKRSGVQLINHIDEGLKILRHLNATESASAAFCIHPLLQADDALTLAKEVDFSYIDPWVLILGMEYRSVANEYLSMRTIDSIEEIRLSPLSEVNQMLIADKVQNRKDFEFYHLGKHSRSDALQAYFTNWLRRLGISEEKYQQLISNI